MAAFTYRARDGGGQLVRGRLEAPSRNDAVVRLRGAGLLVLELAEERSVALGLPAVLGRRVKTADLIIFYRQLATMVEAGLPLVSALEVLSRQVQSQQLSAALRRLVGDLKAGESLAGAMSRVRVFPPMVVHMVAAAEVGGILDRVLNQIATQSEKEEAVRQKVQSALVYPVVVMGLATTLVLFLVTFVVPRFAQYFGELGQDLPAVTAALIAISEALVRFGWLLPPFLVALTWFGRRWLQTAPAQRSLDRLQMRLPVVGPLLHKRALGRFARILGGLLGSGIPLVKALAIAANVPSSPLIAEAVLAALSSVRRGESLARALSQTNRFPPMMLEMVGVGEHSGTLEPMLLKVADFYESDVHRLTERLSGALEPFLIVTLGVVVGSIVIAMMAPVFQLWTLIR